MNKKEDALNFEQISMDGSLKAVPAWRKREGGEKPKGGGRIVEKTDGSGCGEKAEDGGSGCGGGNETRGFNKWELLNIYSSFNTVAAKPENLPCRIRVETSAGIYVFEAGSSTFKFIGGGGYANK